MCRSYIAVDSVVCKAWHYSIAIILVCACCGFALPSRCWPQLFVPFYFADSQQYHSPFVRVQRKRAYLVDIIVCLASEFVWLCVCVYVPSRKVDQCVGRWQTLKTTAPMIVHCINVFSRMITVGWAFYFAPTTLPKRTNMV